MGTRRQIYLSESENRMLQEQSRTTGLSVSELVRRAVHRAYGIGPPLSWDEYFATRTLVIGAGADGPVPYSTLFGAADEELIDRELDAFEAEAAAAREV